jgi:sugar phosphate isomerase/epimerase
MAIHLHDDNGIQTQHKLPFDGTINWLKVMNGLASIDYKGALAIEGMNWAYKDLSAREYLQEAFNRAKKLDKLKSESLIRGFI